MVFDSTYAQLIALMVRLYRRTYAPYLTLQNIFPRSVQSSGLCSARYSNLHSSSLFKLPNSSCAEKFSGNHHIPTLKKSLVPMKSSSVAPDTILHRLLSPDLSVSSYKSNRVQTEKHGGMEGKAESWDDKTKYVEFETFNIPDPLPLQL